MTSPRKLVIDASVVVKWYVPEIGSDVAAAVLGSKSDRLAPDLLAAEFGNVLWKKVRQGELGAKEAMEIAEAFASACPVAFRPTAPFLPAALDIAIRWQRTVYDALYLALALAEECSLITADSRLVAGLEGTPLEQTVQLLNLGQPA